jgi:hypothetical protein
MKNENVMCEHCGKSFEKSSREVRRSVSLKRRQYCSRSCVGKSSANLAHLATVSNKDVSKLNPSNRRDEFTPFREHFRRATRRNKLVTMSLENLKEQWDLQKGICSYSRVSLVHPAKNNSPLYTASLDRIDSSQGYIKGNIQFISISMNLMKSSMSHKQMMFLLEILRE